MQIDILDPRFYDDPWDGYRWLRNESPIHWDETNELWVVSRHEDVSHVSRHPELYSAAQGVRPKIAAPMGLISMDDPEHTTQRRLINRGFTPRMVREMSEHIRDLSNRIIDDISDRGECDFVEEFAIHVPLIVISELMGLDPSQRDQLYRWSDAMMAGDGHVDPDDPVLHAAAQAFGEYAGMCTELIEAPRGDPDAQDIIGILTNAYDEGVLAKGGRPDGIDIVDELSSDELLMFLTLLLIAGNETTRNALSGGLLAFSLFPDEKQKLLADPGLIDLAVDEIVRYVSPVLSFNRTITESHVYKDTKLEAGEKVLMLYQSANRDESVFEDADSFRVDRDPNPHLGFGIGTHFCLGANLARAEIKVVFEELFRRLRDIHVPDWAALARGDSSLVLALQHLPAVFTPEKKLALMTELAVDSRARILDAALELMATHGVAGTSMRRLAGEAGLNVATLYHYFPSKADLLGAVIAERSLFERLSTEGPPASVRGRGSSQDALNRMLRWMWRATQDEESVWRLIIGESLRGEPAARQMSLALVDGIDAALEAWIVDFVPELADRAPTLARLARGLLFALVVEHLALGPDLKRADDRIAEFVEALVP